MENKWKSYFCFQFTSVWYTHLLVYVRYIYIKLYFNSENIAVSSMPMLDRTIYNQQNVVYVCLFYMLVIYWYKS